ncbi:hypothetical protein A3I18_02575 [Candidatus Campbellbacteria bacterium RIFCSPLOWO2_02_FULL_35_11]|uniref:TVP38/TMEM64 family membrane protein n=2 Tax=Candidatus Campbelliibacteriota TaxID=1752727 RepID=A0A1F5EM40_9BACT|nr:MAG: hypothetical protein A3E89_00350 [Candidatus Campbellbacteria bacterium RIFCSPHIGHO2_12_FULL_35_10]OGD69960.1 MAG: hypothetical protein A3I18_02575 [Candidatus Campbellbacteria bacterium RIFCSPLOWO2_02_FULL_35_11]
MKKKTTSLIILFFLFVVMVASFFWQTPFDYLEQLIKDNSILSVFSFIFLMIISEVVAPVTVLPLVPVAALFFGPFYTAIYSVIGWVIGAAISFWISRRFGKPIIDKFVSEKDALEYKKYIPDDIDFWWLVFLRMVIPVDVLSYLIGLFTNMNFSKFILATTIGIIPFSFIFSYGYQIFFLENIFAVVLTGVFLISLLSLVFYFHKKGRI